VVRHRVVRFHPPSMANPVNRAPPSVWEAHLRQDLPSGLDALRGQNPTLLAVFMRLLSIPNAIAAIPSNSRSAPAAIVGRTGTAWSRFLIY